MAQQVATVIELDGSNGNGNQTRKTVADGTGITKFAVLTQTSPNTAATVAAADSASGYVWGGISAAEKEASDGATNMPVWRAGLFEAYASGTVTVGQIVKSCGNGYFMTASYVDFASGAVAGRAESTASAPNKFQLRLIN